MENQIVKQSKEQQNLIKSCKTDQQNTLVKSFEGFKLKNIASMQPIADLLTEIYVLVGLTVDKYPNELEEGLLIKFVHSKYQHFTLNEIRLSFTLAVTRDLNAFLSKDENIGHYQNFSVEYFCKIMAAYSKYKAHQLIPLLAKTSKMPFFEEKSDYDFIKSNFVDQFPKYKAGQYPWKYGADVMIFDILVKHEVINVNETDKKTKSNEIKHSLDQSKFKEFEQFKLEWANKVKIYFFKQYIQEVNEFDLDINTIIKNKIQ